MIKATNKKTQQFLVHAVLGESIGEIEGHRVVEFTRANKKGFLVFNSDNIVVDIFSRLDRDIESFNKNFVSNEEKLNEIKDYICL